MKATASLAMRSSMCSSGVSGSKSGNFHGATKTAGRSGAGPVRDVDVEAVLERRVGLGAEVPFAEMAGGVAGVLEASARV